MQVYIDIKDKSILVNIKSYKTAKSMKLFIKGDVIVITKPSYVTYKNIVKYIRDNEEEIYNIYINNTDKGTSTKKWVDGEQILFNGEMYEIKRHSIGKSIIKVSIDVQNKLFNITVGDDLIEEILKPNVDKCVKNVFKSITQDIVAKRLLYWENLTQIKYESFKVHDMISRFGSCMPSKRALNFNSRLCMFSNNIIDAVIVHELCHIIHKNHSADFYNLVSSYIPNYKEIDKWLKHNGKYIII